MNLRFHFAGEGVCRVHSGPQPLPPQPAPLLALLLQRLVRQNAAPRDPGSSSSSSRPLDGDAGILSRATAVELHPQVFCSCTPHGRGAHGCRRTALTLVVRYHRVAGRRSLPSPCRTGGGLSQVEETVDVVPPLLQGVWRGCFSRGGAKQLPSRCQRCAARSL